MGGASLFGHSRDDFIAHQCVLTGSILPLSIHGGHHLQGSPLPFLLKILGIAGSSRMCACVLFACFRGVRTVVSARLKGWSTARTHSSQGQAVLAAAAVSGQWSVVLFLFLRCSVPSMAVLHVFILVTCQMGTAEQGI